MNLTDDGCRTGQIDLKVCGITRMADLRLVARVGASCFGTIVEIPRSPKSVSVQVAAMLGRAAAIPQVCVMETDDAAAIAEVVSACKPAAIQLHTEASSDATGALRAELGQDVELWVALGLPPRTDSERIPVAETVQRIGELAEVGVARIVLDTATAAGTGGTGKVSNWEAAAEIVAQSALPIMLAGGITPENVAEAIMTVRPQGIDVSSGVEAAPGVKDAKKLAELAEQFRRGISLL